jgi:hypothetical protein
MARSEMRLINNHGQKFRWLDNVYVAIYHRKKHGDSYSARLLAGVTTAAVLALPITLPGTSASARMVSMVTHT